MRTLVASLALSFPLAALAAEPHAEPAHPPADAHAAPADGHAAPQDAHAAPADAHAAPAHAAPADGHAAPAHGDAHAADPHAADAHGDAAHHGPHYSGDVDGDGTPNWLDPDADATMGDGTYQVTPLLFHAINLALFLGAIVFGFGGRIRDGLRARAVGIRSELEDAARVKRDAEARHAEVKARLAALEAEIAKIEARATEDAAAEQAQIELRAQAVAVQIGETAKRQIADEAARARQSVRREAIQAAVQLAEGIVAQQLKSDDQKRLAEQFLAAIGTEGRHV